MSEIKVGEYVRTKVGNIDKLKEITNENRYLFEKSIIRYTEENIKNMIVKHSKNKKELIQEGDILQYQINKISCTKIGKVKKYKDARSFKEYLGVEGFNIEQIEILKILTKEKFEEESYKVGE